MLQIKLGKAAEASKHVSAASQKRSATTMITPRNNGKAELDKPLSIHYQAFIILGAPATLLLVDSDPMRLLKL
jgi:hypothetical protein